LIVDTEDVQHDTHHADGIAIGKGWVGYDDDDDRQCRLDIMPLTQARSVGEGGWVTNTRKRNLKKIPEKPIIEVRGILPTRCRTGTCIKPISPLTFLPNSFQAASLQ